MATKSQRNLVMRLKRARRERNHAEKKHRRAVAAYKKLLRTSRAA